MHELVSSILGSSSDDIVAPLQLKPISLATLELVYAQLISRNHENRSEQRQQNSTPVPDYGENVVDMVIRFFNQKSRKTTVLGTPDKSSPTKLGDNDVNDFWTLSSISGSSVTQSMTSASTSILLNAEVVRNSRIRLGVLSNIWKNLKSMHTNTTNIGISIHKDLDEANCCSSRTGLREASGLQSALSPSLADIGCQTAFSIAISFLKNCWRSSPSNYDLCSDVLCNCVDALSGLPPGSLHSPNLTPGVVSTLKKAREFLVNVARNSLPGVASIPDMDRQYALSILLYFAFAEGSLTYFLEFASLIFELSSFPSNDVQGISSHAGSSYSSSKFISTAPVKSALFTIANQIQPQYIECSSPASEIILKSNIFEQQHCDENEFSLKSASMLTMALLDCLIQPILSTNSQDRNSPSSRNNNNNNNNNTKDLKPQMLGWGVSELISFGSHNVTLSARLTGGNARVQDVADMAASQYFLVVLMRHGNVFQLPICDLSQDTAVTVITGNSGDSSINSNIIAVASCPTSTNCLALAGNGELFYWEAAPTDRELPSVEPVSLRDVFIVKIAAGFMYQAGLSTDGDIYIWGRNQHGQLGTGSQEDEPLPVKIPAINGSKFVDVSLSASPVGYTAAVTESGHVFTWGGGSYWRLGHGASVEPLRILSLEDVTNVFAGEHFTAAITKQGRLNVWGRVFGDNQMPHELDLLSPSDSVKTLAQNSNRLLVITMSGKVLLYGRDFSRSTNLSDANSSSTSFLDDPTKPRLLTSLECSLASQSIKVKAACTPLAGFLLILPEKRGSRKVGELPPLTVCFQQEVESLTSMPKAVNMLLDLLCLAIDKHNPNLCVFVIEIFRAYSVAGSNRKLLNAEQKSKLQTYILQLSSAPFVDMTVGQQTLGTAVESLVSECWLLLYTTPEERLSVLLKLVRSCTTVMSRILFRTVVDIVIKNGDLGKFVNDLIQTEAINASIEMESILAGDASLIEGSTSGHASKKSKVFDNERESRKKNCFTEDSSSDLIVLITTLILDDRRRVSGRASDIFEQGIDIAEFHSAYHGFHVNNTDGAAWSISTDEAAHLITHFMRHLFSHITYCSCAGSPDGCPATSICRGIALAKDFANFFCSTCEEILQATLRLGKMSPAYMLYACDFYKTSLICSCLPEVIDSFLAILLFAKHHFIGSDNGRPLGLFLVSALQPLLLSLIELDGSFSHYEQWLDAYVMSWQSALPSRTLHQRFNVQTIANSTRPCTTVVHGCVLDISETSLKDLSFLDKDLTLNALRGRESTPILMTSTLPSRELCQKIRCFITRYGIGRFAEEGDSDGSVVGPTAYIPPFRDVLQSIAFAISLFSVEVLSQEPVSQFPEDLVDLVQSGMFRSALISDFDASQIQPVGDFISSLSGQRPHASYADVIEKILAIFDSYLTANNFHAVKNAANENVALRAVKRYSLAAFIRHMDVAEPVNLHLSKDGDGSDLSLRLPIVLDCFRSVASILSHIVKQFQQQSSPAADHSSICSPIFFALRFLLNSVDPSFDFSYEISQRMLYLRKKHRWQHAVHSVARQEKSMKAASGWDNITLFLRDKTCRTLYNTWRNGLLDDERLIACSRLTRFVQFAKISQITELKLRFRMHIELAVCQTETAQMLTEVFSCFSCPFFEHLGITDLKAMPHLLEAFLAGLSFSAINSLTADTSKKPLEYRYTSILSRKSERALVESWERLTFKLVDALGQVSSLFSNNMQLSLICPIVLYLSAQSSCPETSSLSFMQGFLARLIRVLSNLVDQHGNERLKTIAYPKCLVLERKVREKKYKLDSHDDDVGPEMAQRLIVGSEVVRGPHWCWGDQDSSGDPNGRSAGIVLRPVTCDGWVRVRWSNGITNNYRMGRDGRYDLRLAQDDNTTANNADSSNEAGDDDDDDIHTPALRSRTLLSDMEREDEDEFHSIESGAESVVDGSFLDDGKTAISKKLYYQPLINLLVSCGQRFLQNLLTSATLTKPSCYIKPNANRFLHFLLHLYNQFWTVKLYELTNETDHQASVSPMLSGGDTCFRDIYGFALLHELVVHPLFASILVRDVAWLNLFSKILKEIQANVCRMHPHFFVVVHILVIVKSLFKPQIPLESIDEKQTDAIWNLFSVVSDYLHQAIANPVDETSLLDDWKVPQSATYFETIIIHSVDCLRRMYMSVSTIQKNVNSRIQSALVSYSHLLNSITVKASNKNQQLLEQDFGEILTMLAFMGAETEGRPYCGAEVTSPVFGHIQFISQKTGALVLVRSNGGAQAMTVHLGKIVVSPISSFKLQKLPDDSLDEPIHTLVLKHIAMLDYLDHLLTLVGADVSVVNNSKKSLLFLSAKLFMQFVSSMNNDLTYSNGTDFVQLIEAAARSTTVRPKYSPYIIQSALTPLIDVCRRFILSASPVSTTVAHQENEVDDVSSVHSTGTLQTLSVTTTCDSARPGASQQESFEGTGETLAHIDDSNLEEPDVQSSSSKHMDNSSASDDDDNDTVTTIECGELVGPGPNWEDTVTLDDEQADALPSASEDDSDVRRLVEMGFSRSHIYEAYASLLADVDSHAPSLETIVNWLIENPSLVDDSTTSGSTSVTASGNLCQSRSSDRRIRQPLFRRSLNRFLASTLTADEPEEPPSMALIGATSSSTSNEEGDDNAGSSSEERPTIIDDIGARLRPPIAAFGRAVRRTNTSPTVVAAEVPAEITASSEICVGQIVKSLTRIDKVVFGETGYVLRVTSNHSSHGLSSPSTSALCSQFRPLNRLLGSSSSGELNRSTQSDANSPTNVLVQWRVCGLRLWVSSTDLQPVAWPWNIKRPIEIGDCVRVRPTVTVPRYKWGSVTHGSIGSVVALLDDLVYVNFQAQHRWAGLRKELEIIPSEPIVICYKCDSDINISSDTIYYRCRKCRPPDLFVVCASCRRQLSNTSHAHGLFAFVKTRGSIFTREERGSTSTFRSPSASTDASATGSAWSDCVSTVLASSNGSLLKQHGSVKPVTWHSQAGVNPPHWIQLFIKPGVILQSVCVELDLLRPESLPNALVLRIGKSLAHLRTVHTFPVSPDVVVVELLPKPLHKYYACVEIRIPGTRGGISTPCRINGLTISRRNSRSSNGHPFSAETMDQGSFLDEDESSDSKKSLTIADEDEILVLSSSSDGEGADDEHHVSGEPGLFCRPVPSATAQQAPPTVVFGWGLNDKEQLLRQGPVKVKQAFVGGALPFGEMGVVSLAFGSKCSFFLTHNGRLLAFGDTTNGRLGLGEVAGTVVTTRKRVCGELAFSFIVKVSIHSGGRHGLALSDDGRVFSWGDGENGKLGHGDEATVLEPKLIRYFTDQSICVRSISAGSSHSACVTSTGELYTWGLGEFGRLGHNDTNSYSLPKLVEAFRGIEVVQVACGSRDAQTLVLTADEMVWSFGDGDYGKLGRGGNESCLIPTVIPDLTGLGVCQVACGAQFSLVRTKCGKIFSFGKGDYYRLGHGTESHYRRPQQIVGGGLADEKVVDVAVGALHSLAICASGKVYLWGDGDHYQQGNGNSTASRVPTMLQGVPKGYKVIAAACGSSHTGIVCMVGGGDKNFANISAVPTPSMRVRSLSSDTGIKPLPLPFALPFDPLGQTVIGLLTNESNRTASPIPATSALAGVSSPTGGGSGGEVKQSLAFRILSKNGSALESKRKLNSNCRSSSACVIHLLRSHIIYRLRAIICQLSEKSNSVDTFEKLLRSSIDTTGRDSTMPLIASFNRIFKMALSGRMSFNHNSVSDSFKTADVPVIATATHVLQSCDRKLLLDAFLPDLKEISRISAVSPKSSPLDLLPAIVQESPHPYAEKSSLSGNVSIPGATTLRITFDSQCSTEKRRDVLSICDYAGRIVSLKSGRDWLSDWSTPEEIIVEGDFISWTFRSDAGSPAGWGFRFFVSSPNANRAQQLLTFSDRKICSLPSLEAITTILPAAKNVLNIDDIDDTSSGESIEGGHHPNRLSNFLNALADVSKNGFIAPVYRNWAVSLCAEICLSHFTDQFIERPLVSLANLLTVQYDYEESVVRPGRHLIFSVFCRKLVSLAIAVRLDRISPALEQASWFQRLVQFIHVSLALLDRDSWPDWFTAAVNFRLASSSPAPKDRDKDQSAADDFLDNSKFSLIQDEQLVAWYNSAPEEWTLSEAAGWRVFAFGHNHRGQLSLADGPKVKTPSSVPLIEQLEPIQIVGGEQSTFVVSRDGKVYSFGYGAGGRLGLGGADSVTVPTLIRTLNDIHIVEIAISSGGKHCLARSIEGQVWSWGDNDDGALGHGNRVICDQPKLIKFFNGQSVTRIAAGSAHSAAITADGQLFTWGRGRYGRLGHGDSEDQLAPLAIVALRNHIVIDVACGTSDSQTIALTADGTVWSFGDGDYGKLGRGGSDGCRVPLAIPTLSDKDVIQVACGSQFSACLTRQGAVYTWGKGEYFRLGQGTTDHVRTPRRVAGLLGKRVIKIAIGSLHSLVLTSDGEVYAFGDNDEGQLGDGSTQPAPRPRLVSVLRNRPITHIAVGSAHSFAWTVPSLSASNMTAKPAIRYPSGPLPVDCPSLDGIDRLTLRNRLLCFELFSENFWQSVPLLRFTELPDDFPTSNLVITLSAAKLAPFLLLPHKEATLRRVVSLTTQRDRQHGPVINIDRVSRRASSGQCATVFEQLSAWLPTLLSESSLFLANRCWKVRFVAESVDDCGGGFSDSIADACEEIQSGLTSAAHLVGAANTPCAQDGMLDEDAGAVGGADMALPQYIVFRPDGKAESLRFLGVLMGIAIRTGSPLSLSIAPTMWRLMVSAPSMGFSCGELCELDPSLVTSLREIAQMSDELLEASELPLAVPNIFGHLVPLLTTTSNCHTITPQNREKFLSAAYSYRQHEFDEALKWISEGLGRVVPLPLLRLFTPMQLEWLVCGSSDVSVDVLRSITCYRGGLDSTSPLVRWFWDVVEGFRPTERAQLLRFVWGRSRLPRRMSDFRGRDFVIQPLDKFGEPPAADAYLPEASTCFFMLKLPRYSCRDILEARLRYAISACQSIDLDDYVGATGGSQMTVTEVLLNNPNHF